MRRPIPTLTSVSGVSPPGNNNLFGFARTLKSKDFKSVAFCYFGSFIPFSKKTFLKKINPRPQNRLRETIDFGEGARNFYFFQKHLKK